MIGVKGSVQVPQFLLDLELGRPYFQGPTVRVGVKAFCRIDLMCEEHLVAVLLGVDAGIKKVVAVLH